MKTLLLYSTSDGQTRAIASRIAEQLQTVANCHICDIEQASSLTLSDYQAIVIGASVRYGHFSTAFKHFTEQHAEQLNLIPSAFFSVNLTARKADKNTPETNPYTRKFLANSAWQPKECAVFAGALRYPQYKWFDRIMIQLIMKMTGGETDSSKEIEYTDWQQVSDFTDLIAKKISLAAANPAINNQP